MRNHRLWLGAMLAGLLTSLLPAAALAASPELTLSSGTGAAGDSFAATYNAGTPCKTQLVDFTFDSAKLGIRPVESPGCTVAPHFNVPPSAAAGPHQVCAQQEDGPGKACATFTVAAAGAAGQGATAPPGNAATPSDTSSGGAAPSSSAATPSPTSGGGARRLILAALAVLVAGGWVAAYVLVLRELGFAANATRFSLAAAAVLILFLVAAAILS